MTQNHDVIGLGAWVIAGQILAFGTTLVLAAGLTTPEFAAYVTASSLFTLLVALAPLGTEKLALRVLPPAFDDGDGGLVRRYLRFAVRRVALGSGVAAFCALVWALALADLSSASRLAALVGCLALPFGAATHLGQEVLTAARQARPAMFAARFLVPATALGLIAMPLALGAPVSGAYAIFAWTLGWLAAAALIWRDIPRLLPPGVPAPLPETPDWAMIARPFWLYRLAVGVRAQAGPIALVWLGAAPGDVGSFATATAIVGLLVVPIAATNRVFARDIARHLRAGDPAAITVLHRRRLRWLVPVATAFALGIWIWAAPILALVRPEFAGPGTVPLRILALAAMLTLIFALAPTQLKFQGRSGVVFAVIGAASAVQVALLIALIPRYGAAGATVAYALPTGASYVVLAGLARQGD